MKYVGDLITEVRRDTRNEDVPTDSSQVGISTEDFLRYANFAQEKCQAIAIASKSTKFQETTEIDLVSGQIAYTVDDNVYLDEHILNVEYSPSGLARDYYDIQERGLSSRNDRAGSPYFYIRHSGQLLLCPAYQGARGKIRVTYERAADSLDTRRGTIAAAVTASGAVTGITLDITTDDPDAMARAQYLCINDVFGNVTMYNIPITAYDSNTGIVTISGGTHTYGSGESIAVGDYVTVGRYTTTHSKLNSLCERYLAQYTEYKIFRRDSSDDASGSKEDMRETLKEIALSYAETPRDEAQIQVDNFDLMLGEM